MSFMEGILKQNIPVWDKYFATIFVSCRDIKGNPALLFYPELCYGYGIGGPPELSEAVRYGG